MLATLGQPPAGKGWAYEMKWDGQRAVAEVGDAEPRLFSRNGIDVTETFPELIRPLADAVDGLELSGRQVQVPPFWTGVDGDRMLALAREHHLEGVVAKQIDSTYRPGRRAPTWIKTPLRKNTEAVVVGWIDGTGAARDGVGSLLLGAYDDIGNTGCTNVRNSGVSG